MEKTGQNTKKNQDQKSLLRYQAVSAVLAREATGEVRAQAIKAVAQQPLLDSGGRGRNISVRSLYRWLQLFASGGVDGLRPVPVKRERHALKKELLHWLSAEKAADPAASIPELLSRARIKGLIEQNQQVGRTTVWRTLRARGAHTKRGKTGKRAVSRRFCYHHRMQMVLCDGKHFRAGAERSKRVVLFFSTTVHEWCSPRSWAAARML